jgi:hypothetical protein
MPAVKPAMLCSGAGDVAGWQAATPKTSTKPSILHNLRYVVEFVIVILPETRRN